MLAAQTMTMIHKGEILDAVDWKVRCVLDWSALNWCVLGILPAVYMYVTSNCKKIVNPILTDLPCGAPKSVDEASTPNLP